MYNSFSDSELTAHFRMFSNIASGRDTVTLDELARRSGLPYQTVLRDLQRILQRSWFGDGAYINYLSKTLVIRVPEAGAAQERTANPVGGAYADGTYHYSFRAQPLTTMRASERMGQTPAGTASRATASRARKGAEAAASGRNLPAVANKDKKWKRLLMGAGIVCALVAFGNFTDAVDTLSWGGFSYFVENFLSALLWGGLSAGSFIGRSLISRRERRMRSYITMQAGRAAVPIRELADANDITVDRAKRDLEKMIDEGQWGPGAYIDASTDTLYLNYAQPQPRPQAAQPQPEVRREQAAPAQPQPQQAQPAPEQKKGGEYEEILHEIRTLNDSIADPVVSQKISQIEDVTAKIFRIVAEKPEKKSEIKSFMSYYLPTTLKLLRSYSTFEKQGVGGENIDTAKKDIERILDTLVVGFTQQLDQLFQTEALDISSDIEVLEQMMKKDGLSEADDFEGLTMGGV